MSLDTTKDQSEQSTSPAHGEPERSTDPALATDQWDSLRRKIRGRGKKSTASKVFAGAAKKGSIYRWGVAVACGGPIEPLWDVLSRFATDQEVSQKRIAPLDFARSADAMMDAINSGVARPLDAVGATLWAAAMPTLIDHLHHTRWWELLSSLQHYRESVTRREDCCDPSYLIAGGELGLTLSWRLADLPSCSRLKNSSIECVSQWCKQDQESIASALSGATNARLVFASLMRCKKLIKSTTQKKFKKQQARVATELATWVAAMTSHAGGSAMSPATGVDVIDDLQSGGLLHAVSLCDPESLKPAVDAVLGKRHPRGQLAWEVCLPEAFQHSDDARLAVMMPEWDVLRGRVHVDFGSEQASIELFGGKSTIVRGGCQTSIEINDQAQRPIDDWVSTCEYTDDDVHYLEIEQSWSGGIVLQRQVMVVRDDRCVLLADTVLPSQARRQGEPGCLIRYRNRMPLGNQVQMETEPETREAFFSDGRRRGFVMPLSAGEWRIGPSNADLTMTHDKHLLLSATGQDGLFAPLWFDFGNRRFDRKRTWRKLTIADDLRIVSDAEAVGFRVQVGSEQWMLYRSLAHQINRSVLGKHLVADFFAARFYASDGSFEELVTVDDNEPSDE